MHNGRMIYGYARVSSNGQDLTQQVAKLLAAGCVKVYQEKASADSDERPKLKRATGALDAGDVLLVKATDCSASNTRDRKSGGEGKDETIHVDIGDRSIITNTKTYNTRHTENNK